MQLDIRMPVGLLFTFLGIVLTIFGFATKGSEIYKHSLGININVYSGICLLIFGVFMLTMALRAQRKNRGK
jgi:hypothetical protein